MKTLFAACLSRLGLSQAQSAAVLSCSVQSVKDWSRGKSNPKPGVWSDLRAYESQIVDRSETIRESWQAAGEVRAIDATPHDSGRNLMALADFVLTVDDQPPIKFNLVDGSPTSDGEEG